jgi:hypothetical protein
MEIPFRSVLEPGEMDAILLSTTDYIDCFNVLPMGAEEDLIL